MSYKENLYKFIQSHELPLSREDKPIKQFLEEYFEKYINELKTIIMKRSLDSELSQNCYDKLKNKINFLKNICAEIATVFDCYDSPNRIELYNHFNNMMQKFKPFLLTKNLNDLTIKTNFYRMRSGEEAYNRKDLFHIPLSKRELIQSYRFSIPGYPCLYLSSDVALCWFECGMPSKFSYSSFNFSSPAVVNLLDLSEAPTDFISGFQTRYFNQPPDKLTALDDVIVKYILSFPLRVACSLSVSNKKAGYIQEYTFPQLLLLWIRGTNHFEGILYQSSTSIKTAQGTWHKNLVLPAKNIENDYCTHLNKLFKVSEPQKVCMSTLVGEFDSEINKVKEFQAFILSCILEYDYIDPCIKMLSICNTFLSLTDLLKTDNYLDAESIYQTFETLFHFSCFVIEYKDISIMKVINDFSVQHFDSSETTLQNNLKEIYSQFNDNVYLTLINFYNLYSHIRRTYPINQSTCNHIFPI